MSKIDSRQIDFKFAYYSGDRKTGNINIVERKNGDTKIHEISQANDKSENELPDILLGVSETNQVVLLEPIGKEIKLSSEFPANAFAAHKYTDEKQNVDWYMNDGDKQTGNDTLNCGDSGSSVTVIKNADSSKAEFLKTICVGRGHHQANYSFPSDACPDTPNQTYISNLKDGTISVIANDPSNTQSYLNVIKTIDLCEPDKEDSIETTIPNNAFPHGLVFSPVSGKVYNLNNGYGTVTIINPKTHDIESRIEFKGHSNLFLSINGQYVIGRGADRKSNNEHVLAKLSVLDVTDNTVVDSIDIPDIYISKYFFNPEGTRLYLTTSSSGSDKQQENLKTDALLIFDMTSLPRLNMINEVRLGASAGTLDFVTDNLGKTSLVFASLAASGKVAVMDIDGHLLEDINIGEKVAHSRLWCLS